MTDLPAAAAAIANMRRVRIEHQGRVVEINGDEPAEELAKVAQQVWARMDRPRARPKWGLNEITVHYLALSLLHGSFWELARRLGLDPHSDSVVTAVLDHLSSRSHCNATTCLESR